MEDINCLGQRYILFYTFILINILKKNIFNLVLLSKMLQTRKMSFFFFFEQKLFFFSVYLTILIIISTLFLWVQITFVQ